MTHLWKAIKCLLLHSCDAFVSSGYVTSFNGQWNLLESAKFFWPRFFHLLDGQFRPQIGPFLQSFAIIWHIAIFSNHLIGHSYFQLAQSKVKTNYVQLEWFLCQKTKKCGCVKYFLVLCPKTPKMCLCQIFSSFVSENWGRSNYKPDWQNQVIAAQYHVQNQFIAVAPNYDSATQGKCKKC